MAHLKTEQTLLLFKLRKVSSTTVYGSAISSAAYGCHSEENFTKIVTELKEAIDQNEKMMVGILGEELVNDLKNYTL